MQSAEVKLDACDDDPFASASSFVSESVNKNNPVVFRRSSSVFVSEPTESSTACSAICARKETESEFYLLSQIYI